MRTSAIIAALLATASAKKTNYDCKNCVYIGQQYCLDNTNFSQGQCYTKNEETIPENHFCVQKDQITNLEMQDFICPVDKEYCPYSDDTVVVIDNNSQEFIREQTWQVKVPNKNAVHWRCKYTVKVEDEFLIAQKDKQGYVAIQIENYGFDEQVTIILQQKGRFVDYKEGQGKDVRSMVYNDVQFGDLIYMPADMQALIQFAPIRNKIHTKTAEVNDMGRFRMRTWHQTYLSQSDMDQPKVKIFGTIPKAQSYPTCQNMDIPKALQKETKNVNVKEVNTEEAKEKETKATQIHNAEEDEEEPDVACGQIRNEATCDAATHCKWNIQGGPIQCPNAKPGLKLDWACKEVPEGPWYDKELFMIGGTKVQTKHALLTTGILVALGIIVFLVLAFIAYKKRDVIEEAGRASIKKIRSLSQRKKTTASANINVPKDEIAIDVEKAQDMRKSKQSNLTIHVSASGNHL